MRIESKFYHQNNIAFKSGNIRFFSDFDGTFLPISHTEFQNNNSHGLTQKIRNYFSNFSEFLRKTDKGLDFTITTGRTFHEYKRMFEISREKGYEMTLPKSLIVKNGSDEYLNSDNLTNSFPFKYSAPNKEKEVLLKDLTGWDGRILKEKLCKLFEKYNLRIVEAGSEFSAYDYGKESFFAEGNIPYEAEKVFDKTLKADWVIGLRKDGNSKIYISYPYDMFTNPERKKIFESLKEEIKLVLNNCGIKNVCNKYGQSKHEACGRPWQILEPMVDSKLKDKLNKSKDVGLTKLFDTKEALKKAKKNNDLIIVAGDSSNDYEMLNPILYFEESIEKFNKKHPEEKFLLEWSSNPKKFVEILDKHPDLAKEFLDLPLIGVYVKNSEPKSKFKELIECFSNGKYKKIIITDNWELQKGLNEAIRLYCKQNSAFKEKLSPDVFKEVFGIDKKEINHKNTKILNKVILSGILVLAVIGTFLIKHAKITNNKENL